MACMVVEGDVVRVWIQGNNGVYKHRFCVVMERLPAFSGDAVMLMFGCSETKPGTPPDRVYRIEENTRAFTSMKLNNATSFHLEDVCAFDGHSAQLEKRGRTCPRNDFIRLKRLYQIWKAEGHTVVVYPDKARPAAAAAVEKHIAGAPIMKANPRPEDDR